MVFWYEKKMLNFPMSKKTKQKKGFLKKKICLSKKYFYQHSAFYYVFCSPKCSYWQILRIKWYSGKFSTAFFWSKMFGKIYIKKNNSGSLWSNFCFFNSIFRTTYLKNHWKTTNFSDISKFTKNAIKNNLVRQFRWSACS